jgi:DNA-binding response OmpR family regulator
MANILLVEDNKSLNRGINFKLTKEGFNVFSAETLKDARETFNSEQLDLIILDIDLPDGCGLDFCGEVREKSNVYIIFLTACDQEVDMVTGLDMGADDYISKPFSLMVLVSRINALLRRNLKQKNNECIVCSSIIFNKDEMKLYKNKEDIPLTKTELKLIKFLMENSQQILTKEQLLEALWDTDGNFVNENAVAVNIKRLRDKIEDNPSEPKYIKTVRGIGYIWSERCVIK